MTTRREDARRVEKEIANARVPPQGNQAPLQENQVPLQDQAPVIPPFMTNGEIRSTFLILDQAMTTQAQVMTAQANREV